MTLHSREEASGIRSSVSAAEWRVRVELAAAYRLMDYFGFTDLTNSHLCARVPDECDALLIKRHDMTFDEVMASNLVKYDLDGNPRRPGYAKLFGGGLIIHAGVMSARPDVHATIHSHAPAIIGVASQKCGLLPINQHCMGLIGEIGYHDFGGLEFDMRQRTPLIRDLGDKMVALLRNHGSLICGASIGEAMVTHHKLELACRGQIAALSAGLENVVLIPEDVQSYAATQVEQSRASSVDGGRNWRALVRLADRRFPEYRD